MPGPTKNIILLIAAVAVPLLLLSQPAMQVKRLTDIAPKVFDAGGGEYKMPFAGGLNACQFGSMDLNADGIKDLVVFDRQGYRILPFINEGIASQVSYTYHPEYASYFPAIEHWMQLVDYNNDGKEDIFTYTTGGIKVYRNDSRSGLAFTQVSKPYLVSLQGSTLTNIFVTYADFPAIVDVDNDGDKDILTFWGLGSFIEWHKNLSEETYGNADSLVFEKVSDCWGRFAEGAENNTIKLDTCPEYKASREIAGTLKDSGPKHTGSTLLVNDFNNDGLYDLALGDVDYPALVWLTNGGTPQEAAMVSYTSAFPQLAHPVNITSFPACSMVDVNNDGNQDIIASPFEPSLIRTNGANSCWLYTGSASGFNFEQEDFLQHDMIDLGLGAYPLFFDYNGDGLQDIIVGNYGYLDSSWLDPAYGLTCQYVSSLALFENTGSAALPSFRLITRDYLNLSSLQMQSLIPAAGDVDGDGVTDLLCGNSKGKLVYLHNKASSGQPADFELTDPAYMQIDAGDFSAPQVIDLDDDGLNDLVTGNRKGKLSYYHNTGEAGNPSYNLVTDSLGGIDVTNTQLSYYGYSVPYFYKNSNGKLLLFVGSEYGEVWVYSGIENNLDGRFTFEGLLQGIRDGWRSSVAMADINSDTLVEMLAGNYSGGLGFYHGFTSSANGIQQSDQPLTSRLVITPNPAAGSAGIQIPGVNEISEIHINIYDNEGRRLKARFIRHENLLQLDLGELKPGLYLVEAVYTEKNKPCRQTGKLLVNQRTK